MYDLVGLLSFIIDESKTIKSTIELLSNQQISFEGIDGKFSFENNLLKRELEVLQISKGLALTLK